MAHAPQTIAIAGIDLTDLDNFIERVPYDAFDHLRAEAPVSWHEERAPLSGFWTVTRHEDIVAASRDWQTFSSEVGGAALTELRPEEIEARKSMLDTDPPRHTRLRRVVSPLFTPKAVLRYEQFVRELTRFVLDRALPMEEFDFVEFVAKEIPIRVLLRILGVPEQDLSAMIELSDKMLGNADPDIADLVAGRDDLDEFRLFPFSSPAAAELWRYGLDLAAEKRRHPADDLVTRLLNTEVDGERLTESEFQNFFSLLVVAGNETTRQALSHGVLAFIERPGELQRLSEDPALMPTAVEEILRWATPVMHMRRTATRDTELCGMAIGAGDKVALWYVSGNRDEAVFDDPYCFDVGRRPNEHISFGRSGPHFCLGSHLARLEIRVTLEELLPQITSIELTGRPLRMRSNFTNAIRELPVQVGLSARPSDPTAVQVR
jgi:cytochrome P450